MFGFLKKTLKSAVEKLTKSTKSEEKKDFVEEQIVEQKKPEITSVSTKKEEEQITVEAEKTEVVIEKKSSETEKKEKIKPTHEKKIVEEKKVDIPKPKVTQETKKIEIAPTTELPKQEISKPSQLSQKPKPIEQKEKPSQILPAETSKPSPQAKTKTVEPAKEPEKKSLFGKIASAFSTTTISEEKFEELFFEMEVSLLENNVALEIIEKIKLDLKEQLVKKGVPRGKVEETIFETLKQSIVEVLSVPSIDLISRIQSHQKPFIIAVIGVNGSGKTTTLAKMISLLQKNNLSCVVAASDTYRAAAIQQLEHHTTALQVKLVKHDYGSDPSAVAFDAIAHAKAKNIDVVLIDTAGRLHKNTNLMIELHKLIRVAKPDLKIFIGESVTGNDCVEQARVFNELVGIDAMILSKADVDEKGGAALSVSYITQKPILYLGTGQGYDDLTPFNTENVLKSLGLE